MRFLCMLSSFYNVCDSLVGLALSSPLNAKQRNCYKTKHGTKKKREEKMRKWEGKKNRIPRESNFISAWIVAICSGFCRCFTIIKWILSWISSVSANLMPFTPFTYASLFLSLSFIFLYLSHSLTLLELIPFLTGHRTSFGMFFLCRAFLFVCELNNTNTHSHTHRQP